MLKRDMNKWIANLPVMLPVLYVGILLGVSFLATPVKFSAPLLTLPVALDVGKVTFHALIKLEWFLLAACIIALLLNPLSKLNYIFALIVLIILAIQTLWLLPALDARVIIIQQGLQPKASFYHIIYIFLDCVKIIALLSMALVTVGFK